MKTSYTFNDVGLIPRLPSIVKSRSEISLKSDFLEIPIIAAPMNSVCNGKMAVALAKQGALGVIHRFQTIEEQLENIQYFVNNAQNTSVLAFAVGVTGDYLKRLEIIINYLKETSFKIIICLDTANGFSVYTEEAIVKVKDLMSSYKLKYELMSGNVASKEGFLFLQDLGVNYIRVGIGGGSACTTSIVTGIGGGAYSILKEIDDIVLRTSKIIIDGGIRTSGDALKALVLGADFVMLGRLLAGFEESPGELHKFADGKYYKSFIGLASKTASAIIDPTKFKNSEGIETFVPAKGNVSDFIQEFSYGIKSGISYLGFDSLEKARVQLPKKSIVLLSNNSVIERKPVENVNL